MAKLNKNTYTTAQGDKKINCYNVAIPKEIAQKAGLIDLDLKISASRGRIIIEKK